MVFEKHHDPLDTDNILLDTDDRVVLDDLDHDPQPFRIARRQHRRTDDSPDRRLAENL